MTKTKVILTPMYNNYQQMMAAGLEQVRRQWDIAGLRPCTNQPPFRIPADAVSSDPDLAGLLQPPRIVIVIIDHLEIEDGWIDDLIQFWTWGDYGPLYVSVNIFNEQGDLVDDGYAWHNPDYMNHWMYAIEVEAAECQGSRSLTIQAIVTDRLGGMGIQTVTVPLRKRKHLYSELLKRFSENKKTLRDLRPGTDSKIS